MVSSVVIPFEVDWSNCGRVKGGGGGTQAPPVSREVADSVERSASRSARGGGSPGRVPGVRRYTRTRRANPGPLPRTRRGFGETAVVPERCGHHGSETNRRRRPA